jgi:hypothetical protein
MGKSVLKGGPGKEMGRRYTQRSRRASKNLSCNSSHRRAKFLERKANQ